MHLRCAENIRPARAPRPAGFPAHNPRPKAPACGPRAPTSCPSGERARVRGIQVQVNAAGNRNVPARPQKRGVGKHQLRRQQVSRAAAAAVRRDPRESRSAAWPAARSAASMAVHSAAVDHQRNRIQRPRPDGGLRIAVDVVGDAVFVDQPAAFLPAPRQAGLAPSRRANPPARASAGAPPFRP